jgi:cysteinyl-tRNA synthetase
VLFNVPSMPDYGKLSKRPLDEMIAGARVEVAPYKKDPTDFVLWKPSKPGEPSWPSPAGIKTPGRPGWHIECSAMAWKHLGETFDIHGGGVDLVFPHHENEIAQSRCVFHTPVMANYWMHNGFLQVEGEKMSKSLGNFVTIHELLKDWPGEVVRFNMLRTHYRQPMDWTLKGLEESYRQLDNWYKQVGDVEPTECSPSVLSALCDDLNTPQAISELHSLARHKGAVFGEFALNTVAFNEGPTPAGVLKASGNAMSLLTQTETDWRKVSQERANIDPATIEALIDARAAARKAKDFKESDRIRDELAAMGVVLKDGKDGTTWEIAR